MTNEEKILDILASMQSSMLEMDQRLSGRMDFLENTMVKLSFKIETDIEPKLDALAEGHAAILEQLVPCSRVDELENRVKFLESMLQRMNDELMLMKKAQ